MTLALTLVLVLVLVLLLVRWRRSIHEVHVHSGLVRIVVPMGSHRLRCRYRLLVFVQYFMVHVAGINYLREGLI